MSARDRGQCRLEIDPPRRRGGSRRRAVVSDAAGIQRVPGVGTESLRADSAFSRRVSRTTCARVAGPCRAAVSACSAPEPAGCRPACAGAAAAGCVQPSRSGVRVCAGPRAVRRLEIDPPGRRGGSRRRAVVSDAAGIQRVPGVGTESLRADSAFSRRYSGPPARVAGPCRAAVSACSAGTGRMPACAGAAAAGCVQPSRSRSACLRGSAGSAPLGN